MKEHRFTDSCCFTRFIELKSNVSDFNEDFNHCLHVTNPEVEHSLLLSLFTKVVGTVGYAAPEYVQTGRLTAKSDVWSFGVVLYELITGRRAVERNLPRSEQKLLEWVRPYASDSKKFHLIVDPRVEGQYCIKSAQKLASLANRCLMKQPKSRPKMSEVVEILGNIISEMTSQDEDAPPVVSDAEEAKEEITVETEPESTRQGNNYLKKVFDIREIINLRNKSFSKLDWRNWTPGLVRTW